MTFLDIVIIVLLLWGAYKGWTSGFLKQLVSLIGFLVGLLVASFFYMSLGKYLAPKLGSALMLSDILAFIILWVIVPIFLGFLANGFTRALKGMKLGIPNSVLGMVLGVLKFLILLSCVFNVMDKLGIVNKEKGQKSIFYQPVKGFVGLLFDKTTSSITTEERRTSDTVFIERNP